MNGNFDDGRKCMQQCLPERKDHSGMATSRVDIKVVLLGKEYGGKTSLVERFLHDRFAESVAYQNVSYHLIFE